MYIYKLLFIIVIWLTLETEVTKYAKMYDLVSKLNKVRK